MNKNRPFPWIWAVISVVAIAAIVVSVLPISGLLPAAPTATPRDTGIPTTTATPDVCAPANVQPVALEFNGFAREFDDYRAIAENTPSQDLAEPIANLQRIRREAEDFEIPICLVSLRELQLSYMNTFIDALITLYSFNTDSQQLTQQQYNELFTQMSVTVNQQISLAFQYYDQYLDEMARIMGVTRVPSPTVAASTETPAP